MTKQRPAQQLEAPERPQPAGAGAARAHDAAGGQPAAKEAAASGPPAAKRQRRQDGAELAAAPEVAGTGGAAAAVPRPADSAHAAVETAAGTVPGAAAAAKEAVGAAEAVPEAERRPNQCPLPLRYLRGRHTLWRPQNSKPTLNVRLDGRIVQSAAGGARISYSNIVVLDDFIDEATRIALLGFLTKPADHSEGKSADGAATASGWAAAAEAVAPFANGEAAAAATESNAAAASAAAAEAVLPQDKWERRTADQAGYAATWGVKEHVLRLLARSELPAVQEVHARLLRLYPDMDIAHMPSDLIQQSAAQPPPGEAEAQAEAADHGIAQHAVDCDQFVANAAVAGDTFAWHIDADPAGFPRSPWTDAFGDYCNGEPGRPLFVSLILYLDNTWRRDWDAETLFLDSLSDVGVVVRPKRCRAILMDQDVLHRLSAPSPFAGRPRFSLVWKLVFVPRSAQQTACLARPEWGPPTSFASAARMDAVCRAVLSQQH